MGKPFIPGPRPSWLIAATVLLAAFYRFYLLYQIPPGFAFDQAFNAFDILRLMQGQLAIFFPANTGREPLFIYLQLVGVELLGPTSFALRFVSACIGIITIPLVYRCALSLFKSSRVALLTALFTSISFWHVFFSRDGLRVILEVPFTLMTFWFFWRGQQHGRRKDFVLAGVFLALALYTYVFARTIPIALAILTAYAALDDRKQATKQIMGLGWSLLLSLALCVPLVAYFIANPDQFLSHTSQVSILPPDADPAEIGTTLLNNGSAVLGMFLWRGDLDWIRNLPGRPIFDPLMGSLFVVGAGCMLVSLAHQSANSLRRTSAFLACWIGLAVAATFFSDRPPNFLRALPGLPALMMLPAWGAALVWDRVRNADLALIRPIAAVGLGGMIVASAFLSFRDYFVAFGTSPALYYSYDEDKVEIANWINSAAQSEHLYLSPLFYQQGTISLLTRAARLKSFDNRDTIVLPDAHLGQDAVFAFPPEQEKRVVTLADRLAGMGRREDLISSKGARLLWLYRVPTIHLPGSRGPLEALLPGGSFVQPQSTERSVWKDQIELFGYSISPEGPGGRNLTATLFLRALRLMTDDYTFSVKARNEVDRVWGQEDKLTGDNGYPTSQWDAGDLVIERFYPTLDPCAPAGPYHLTAEAYNLKTGDVLTVGRIGTNIVPLGSTQIGPSEGNRIADLQPDHQADIQISPDLRLLGFTMPNGQLRSGGSFSASLYWFGHGQGVTQESISIQLRDASQANWNVAQRGVSLPAEGQGLCTQFDIRVPAGVAPGRAQFLVNGVEIDYLEFLR